MDFASSVMPIDVFTPKQALDQLIEDMPNGTIRDLKREVARFRSVKSPSEQALLKKAADVSGLAHTKVSVVACAGVCLFRG